MHVWAVSRWRLAVLALAGLMVAVVVATVASPGASGASKKAGTSVTDYVNYVAGKKGKADSKLKPFEVGWVNNQGGSVSPGPTSTDGAKFAEKLINAELGGVGGHPVKLVTCYIPNTEEQGKTCGQKFQNDKNLHIFAFGGVAVGATAFEQVIKGRKPMVCGVCINAADNTNPNTYIIFGANTTNAGPWGTQGKLLKAKTAAVVYPNNAGFIASAKLQNEGLKAAGIKSTLVGFDPASTDITGALQAAGVDKVDAIVPNGAGTLCVTIAKAFDTLKIDVNKVIATPVCLSPDVKKALGDFPKWSYGTAQDNLDLTRPVTAAYKKYLAKYKMTKWLPDPWFAAGFSEVMTAVQWANKVGYDKADEKTLAAEAKKWKGPLLLGPPHMICGAYKKYPASCADEIIFFKYKGNDVFKAAGDWIRPPKSLQP